MKFVVSRKFGGVRFIIYKNDHPPRHAHGFSGDCEAIIDLRSDGNVTLAKRVDAVRPANAKRSDIGKILRGCGRKFRRAYSAMGEHS